jgi:UDP-GlcNAc:undecaprenyl-phosphate/decaprenyl-phosphate GlcNAc-1-phosphate transferase
MTYQLLESFIIALSVTVVLIPPVQVYADRFQLQDHPNARKVHSTPIPRAGGICMFLGSFVAFFLNWPLQRESLALILSSAVIFLFGLWDDRNDLNYKWKFLGQLLAAGIIVIWGGIRLRYFPFLTAGEITDGLAIPVTIFVLLGIINAINLADGLDGLAGGMVLLSFCTVAALAFKAEQFLILSFSLAVIGSTAGFLRYNTYPATIFMGDAGSQFLGLMLGSLAILLTHTETTAFSPVLPLLIVGLPILDTLLVMVQRLSEGRSPFAPDKNHLHHRLLGVGLTHSEAVLLIYLLQSSLVSFGYFACFQSDALIVAFYLLFSVSLVGILWWVSTGVPSRCEITKDLLAWGQRMRRKEWHEDRVMHAVALVLALGLSAYFLYSVLLAAAPDRSLTLLVVVLAAGVGVLALTWPDRPIRLLEQTLVYAAITALVYVNEIDTDAGPSSDLVNAFFIALALVVILGFRFCDKLRFRLTPLDFLTVFVAVALPIYAHTAEVPQAGNFGVAVAKMCTLFYATEIVIANLKPGAQPVRMAAFVVLASLSLRGMLN